ncbi:MAG: DUF4149 domain-containing protein [Gammaproteobacteria bacterium]
MFNRFSITHAGQRVLLTLWVGGLWATGYLVAPLLFQVLDDRRLAGEIAGKIFSVMNYVGLACGMVLLAAVIFQSGRDWLRAWQLWVLIAMLVLVSIGEFILQPMIHVLKAATPGGFIEGSASAARFGMLHGISSLLFLATSLLGLALVAFGFNRNSTD